jgi:hypothetical protein
LLLKELTCIIHEFTPKPILTGNNCPHYPTFLFASPKRKVAKKKLYAVILRRYSATWRWFYAYRLPRLGIGITDEHLIADGKHSNHIYGLKRRHQMLSFSSPISGDIHSIF